MITDSLCEAVQHNCNIADAKHAGNFTLCTYLMKMREYCRWDKGYSCNDVLSKEEVGEWVTQRESLWDQLEQQSFKSIQIEDKLFDPFDTDAINESLFPYGMVYSGGIGARSVPHFFLGKLDAAKSYDDYDVVICAEECARDLGSPPAMTLQNKIFIRKESIRRMLWEKLQESRWSKLENAASRAFSFYDFKHNLDDALDQMTEVESCAIILHEQGEMEATKLLGTQWKEFLSENTSSRLDLMLRAIKDFYADSISTLPMLIDKNKVASIHFYAANMSAMRKHLCPSFLMAYRQWFKSGSVIELKSWLNTSKQHWPQLCADVLLMYENKQSEHEIEKFIEDNRL